MSRFLILVLAVLLVPSSTAAPSDVSPPGNPASVTTWTVEPVGYHGGSAEPSLALDSSGAPHVLYCPPGDEEFATRTATGWQSEHIAFTIFGGGCGQLVFGPGDVPHVTTLTAKDALKELYGTRANGSWDLSPYPGGSLEAVNARGEPQVVAFAWQSRPTYHWRYLTLVSGTWVQEDVETFSSPALFGDVWVSLVLDASDNPHVLYYDDLRGDVRYGFLDSAGWHVEVVEHIGFIGTVGRQGSLAVDSRGAPHVAYFVRTDDPYGEVRYGVRTPTGWISEVVSAVQSFAPSLALGPGDTPQIAFQRLTWVDRPRVIYELDQVYATRLPTGWSEEVVFDGFWDNPAPRGQLPQFPTLIADGCGNPHLAFYVSWWEGLDGSRSGAYYATKGEPCKPGPGNPADLKAEAIQRIKLLKGRALERGDWRFVVRLDEAERSMWRSLGYADPFRPRSIEANPAADVSVVGNRRDRVNLALGPSWTTRLSAYDGIRVTWGNGDVTTVDLPNGWPRHPLRSHEEVWVDAWEQHLSVFSNWNRRTGQVTLRIHAQDSSLGFTLSLDTDPVATLSFTHDMRPWWIDGSHLDPKQGHKVFQSERRAVDCLVTHEGDSGDDDDGDHRGGTGVFHGDENRGDDDACGDRDDRHDDGDDEGTSDSPAIHCRLTPALWTDAERAELDAECDAIANLLVKADAILAGVALEEAKDTPVHDPANQARVDREIGRSERAISKGQEAWVRHAYGDAIGRFEEAWEHAERAIRIANS